MNGRFSADMGGKTISYQSDGAGACSPSPAQKKHGARQSIAKRARIILIADEGERNQGIAAKLEVISHVATTWTTRSLEKSDEPVEQRLEDLPRPGAPDTFTSEHFCQMIALACESPQDHGRPITLWTQRELPAEAIKQGIVESISPHHLGRLFKKYLQPQRARYW